MTLNEETALDWLDEIVGDFKVLVSDLDAASADIDHAGLEVYGLLWDKRRSPKELLVIVKQLKLAFEQMQEQAESVARRDIDDHGEAA